MASELLEKDYIGTVIKLNKEKRLIGVYIPKLMPDLYDGGVMENKFPTNNGIDYPYTNINISATIKKINYIWVKPMYKNLALPKVGSKVNVRFLDGVISLAQCWRFDVNGDYDVIEEEKYNKLMNLQIADKQSDVYEEDIVNITLPNDYIVAKSKDGKTVSYNIQENFNFYKEGSLSKVITDLQKSMEYFSNNEYKLFTDTISAINSPVNNDLLLKSEKLIDFDKDLSKLTIENIYDQVKDYVYTFDITDIDTEFNIANNKYKSISDDSDNERGKIKSELINSIKDYFYAPNHYIDDDFNAIKEVLLTRINNTDNLLDAAKQYSYAKILLNGLIDVYKEYYGYTDNDINYTGYIDLFNAASDKHGIKKQVLDSNLRLAFSRAITSTNNTNVQSYINYLKNMFDTTPSVYYEYYKKTYQKLDASTTYYVKSCILCEQSDYNNDEFIDNNNENYYEPLYVITKDTEAITNKNYYKEIITYTREDNLQIFGNDTKYYERKQFTCTNNIIQKPISSVIYYTSPTYNTANYSNIYVKFTGNTFTDSTVYYTFIETTDDVPIIGKSYYSCIKTYEPITFDNNSECFEVVYYKTNDAERIADKNYYKFTGTYLPYGNNDVCNGKVEYYIKTTNNTYTINTLEDYVVDKVSVEKRYTVFNIIPEVYIPEDIIPKPLTTNVITESYKFTNFAEVFEKKNNGKPDVFDSEYFVTKTVIANPEFYRMWVEFEEAADSEDSIAKFKYQIPSITDDDNIKFNIVSNLDPNTNYVPEEVINIAATSVLADVIEEKINSLKKVSQRDDAEIIQEVKSYEFIKTSDTTIDPTKTYYIYNGSSYVEFTGSEFQKYYEKSNNEVYFKTADDIIDSQKSYYIYDDISLSYVKFTGDNFEKYYEKTTHEAYNETSDNEKLSDKTYYTYDGETYTEYVDDEFKKYYEILPNYEYFETTDDTVDINKSYYTYDEATSTYIEFTGSSFGDDTYYERNESYDYIETADDTILSGKTYYTYDPDTSTYIAFTGSGFGDDIYYERGYTVTSDNDPVSGTTYYTFNGTTYLEFTGNSFEKYYEKIVTDTYTITGDITKDSDKIYYITSGSDYVEFTGNEFEIYYEKTTSPSYVETDDLSPVSGKTYYTYDSDSTSYNEFTGSSFGDDTYYEVVYYETIDNDVVSGKTYYTFDGSKYVQFTGNSFEAYYEFIKSDDEQEDTNKTYYDANQTVVAFQKPDYKYVEYENAEISNINTVADNSSYYYNPDSDYQMYYDDLNMPNTTYYERKYKYAQTTDTSRDVNKQYYKYIYAQTTDTTPDQNKTYYLKNKTYEQTTDQYLSLGKAYYIREGSNYSLYDNIDITDYYEQVGINNYVKTLDLLRDVSKIYYVKTINQETSEVTYTAITHNAAYYEEVNSYVFTSGEVFDSTKTYYEQKIVELKEEDIQYERILSEYKITTNEEKIYGKDYYIESGGEYILAGNKYYEYQLSTDKIRYPNTVYYIYEDNQYVEYTGNIDGSSSYYVLVPTTDLVKKDGKEYYIYNGTAYVVLTEPFVVYYEYIPESYKQTNDVRTDSSKTYYIYNSDSGEYSITKDEFNYYELVASAIGKTTDTIRDPYKQYYTKPFNTYLSVSTLLPTGLISGIQYYTKSETIIEDSNIHNIPIDKSRELKITMTDNSIPVLELIVKI